MRRATRVAIAVTFILLHFYFASLYIESISTYWSQVFRLTSSSGYQRYVAPNGFNGTDKAVVMAKKEEETTDWVVNLLPDWQYYIYTVNNPQATLTTPQNKGHESMAYLSYIIDNYDSLPSTIAFIHAHEDGWWTAWHTDAPSHSNAISLSSLNLAFVQKEGYVNLRCAWKPGCLASHRKNAHITEEIWQYMFWNSSFQTQSQNPDTGETDSTDTHSLENNYENPPFPGEIGAPCCAQFAVSRTQVLRRRKEEYERYRKWIIETELSDAKSGRTMEFLWHIIFGKEAIFCPDPDLCYCEAYGRC